MEIALNTHKTSERPNSLQIQLESVVRAKYMYIKGVTSHSKRSLR